MCQASCPESHRARRAKGSSWWTVSFLSAWDTMQGPHHSPLSTFAPGDWVSGFLRPGVGVGVGAVSPALLSLFQEEFSHPDVYIRDLSFVKSAQPRKDVGVVGFPPQGLGSPGSQGAAVGTSRTSLEEPPL